MNSRRRKWNLDGGDTPTSVNGSQASRKAVLHSQSNLQSNMQSNFQFNHPSNQSAYAQESQSFFPQLYAQYQESLPRNHRPPVQSFENLISESDTYNMRKFHNAVNSGDSSNPSRRKGHHIHSGPINVQQVNHSSRQEGPQLVNNNVEKSNSTNYSSHNMKMQTNSANIEHLPLYTNISNDRPVPQASGSSTFSNIQVNLRLRPLDIQKGGSLETKIDNLRIKGNKLEFSDFKGLHRQYQYDNIFGVDASQLDVFENCGIINLLDRTMNEGYSGTILAYGQTGAGKTFTMEGKVHHTVMEGIIPRAARYIFRHKPLIEKQLSKNGITTNIIVKASFLEIYNETCNDLLNIMNGRNLPTRYNDQKRFFVENLLVFQCDSLDDLLMVIEEGIKNRKVAEHELNADSSRSHSIFTLYFEAYSNFNGYITCRESKLNIVDLCGSEKLKKSKSKGKNRTETMYINKSLLTLGQVISSLSNPDKKSQYVRYRDSKLTSLLADSLGGNSLCIMIANIRPSLQHLDETMNTLNYANKAKNIQNKAIANSHISNIQIEMQQLQVEVARLRNENEQLRKIKGVVSNNQALANETLWKSEDTIAPEINTNQDIQPLHHETIYYTNQTQKQQTFQKTHSSSDSNINKNLMSFKNPLYPNAGIKNKPARLKPIQKPNSAHNNTESDPTIPHPEDASNPPYNLPNSMNTLGFQPTTRLGRIIAEGDKVEEEIRELKEKLEKIRIYGGDGQTPRSNQTHKNHESSPIRRRYIIDRDIDNLEKQLQDALVRISNLEADNARLQHLLREKENEALLQESANERITQDPTHITSVHSETLPSLRDENQSETYSESTIKRNNPQRARRPQNVDAPQLPSLNVKHSTNDKVGKPVLHPSILNNVNSKDNIYTSHSFQNINSNNDPGNLADPISTKEVQEVQETLKGIDCQSINEGKGSTLGDEEIRRNCSSNLQTDTHMDEISQLKVATSSPINENHGQSAGNCSAGDQTKDSDVEILILENADQDVKLENETTSQDIEQDEISSEIDCSSTEVVSTKPEIITEDINTAHESEELSDTIVNSVAVNGLSSNPIEREEKSVEEVEKVEQDIIEPIPLENSFPSEGDSSNTHTDLDGANIQLLDEGASDSNCIHSAEEKSTPLELEELAVIPSNEHTTMDLQKSSTSKDHRVPDEAVTQNENATPMERASEEPTGH